MTTMTMPATVARTQANQTGAKPTGTVSQLMPILVALVLLAVTATAALLISGPMH